MYVPCVFYSDKLRKQIFTKMAHKLAFELIKSLYKPDVEHSVFIKDIAFLNYVNEIIL